MVNTDGQKHQRRFQVRKTIAGADIKKLIGGIFSGDTQLVTSLSQEDDGCPTPPDTDALGAKRSLKSTSHRRPERVTQRQRVIKMWETPLTVSHMHAIQSKHKKIDRMATCKTMYSPLRLREQINSTNVSPAVDGLRGFMKILSVFNFSQPSSRQFPLLVRLPVHLLRAESSNLESPLPLKFGHNAARGEGDFIGWGSGREMRSLARAF